MNKEQLKDFQIKINEIVQQQIMETAEIINNEIKSISEKYDIDSRQLTLNTYYPVDNVTKYEILLRVHEFSIENKVTVNNVTLK